MVWQPEAAVLALVRAIVGSCCCCCCDSNGGLAAGCTVCRQMPGGRGRLVICGWGMTFWLTTVLDGKRLVVFASFTFSTTPLWPATVAAIAAVGFMTPFMGAMGWYMGRPDRA